MMIFEKIKPIITVSTRRFSPRVQPQDTGIYRGQSLRRWGYEAHHHTNGVLPRLKIPEKRLDCMPITQKEDRWSMRLARMGENDFVRILGDERIRQHELLTHIPEWLRGYKADKEYSVLMIKRREFDYWKYSKPMKWRYMNERINFLYRRLNNKYKPPDVEKLTNTRYVN